MGSGDQNTLKRQNAWPLNVVVVGNIAIFVALTGMASPISVLEIAKVASVPALLILFLHILFFETLSADMKARLIFWRWKNPLPGAEAFSKHAKGDARVDLEVLRATFGTLPRTPERQNKLWYKMYLQFVEKMPVREALKRYLFTRDYAVACLIFLMVLGPAALFLFPDKDVAKLYFSLLGVQYMAVRHACEGHGIRLVKTVLALSSGV